MSRTQKGTPEPIVDREVCTKKYEGRLRQQGSIGEAQEVA